MNLNLSPKNPCPCGSGSLLESCCLRDGRVVPKRAHVRRPVGSGTHARCYARGLSGCSSKITLEHFISRSVLARLDPQGAVTVEGMASTPYRASIETLGGKILCSAHNSALDPLDRVGKAFYEEIAGAPARLRSGTGPSQRVTLLNGHDLERWFMKVLLGFVCTKEKEWQPPAQWMSYLFGEAELEPGTGLFMDVKNRPPAESTNTARVQVQVLDNKATGAHEGLHVLLEGYRFGFATKPGMFDGLHRPQAIRLMWGDRDAVHLFGWDSPAFNMTVQIALPA